MNVHIRGGRSTGRTRHPQVQGKTLSSSPTADVQQALPAGGKKEREKGLKRSALKGNFEKHNKEDGV